MVEVTRQTVTIAEAAKALGIGRNAGYEAAHRGEIPTIKIGKRILVPRAALDKMLSGEAA
ncbi:MULTISPECIES: helix-turn-helix domain-containing protein [unclassified Mesorhizobium]|uniref:helix-turn-helix domain-containing protein n=1 Tax=unclassified Mesorhizobium TaxID=325217 RepID=UPI0010936497|nr:MULTISPECIES: helix-turn-helix domain-containing protein [unclassified Mesorhizobium]TGS46014.1 DNA-binding protein [Mesorhizobium sp. M8A.F.Ca.ET.182.01.1.1]TGS81469.1 DNA-binding protein [Mesorhizobium sp. M8A.F.Ca.ET.181.01.1.1]